VLEGLYFVGSQQIELDLLSCDAARNVTYWPKCEVPRYRLYRRYRENSGSDVEIAKPMSAPGRLV
jgi:hypothetical protein